MVFVVENSNYNALIRIHAEKLELSDCLKLKRIINRLSGHNRDIILNLAELKILDNVFVEKLISSQKHCEKNNCTLSLCGVSPDVLCVFYLLKLDKYFEFYENEEEAYFRENRLVKRRLKVV